MVMMGWPGATPRGIILRAIVVSGACVALGSAAGIGSARPTSARTTAPCKPEAGEVVTLRLKSPTQTVRLDVGDTLRVVARLQGIRMTVPKPLDHRHAVCRSSWHRGSQGKVTATFVALRAARKITFESNSSTPHPHRRCRPHRPGGCPAPFEIFGYARVGT
jgi:hypothetical protein